MTKNEIIEALYGEAVKAGITQREIARRMFYNDNTIWSWKKGHSVPTIYNLIDLAEIVGMEIVVRKKGEANDEGGNNSNTV